jgi:hypothetical protein
MCVREYCLGTSGVSLQWFDLKRDQPAFLEFCRNRHRPLISVRVSPAGELRSARKIFGEFTTCGFSENPASASLAKIDSQSSRIDPLLEMSLEALEHLFFDVFDIGEPAPTSDIAVLGCTLNLNDKFFH